jgi:hypothetical protein
MKEPNETPRKALLTTADALDFAADQLSKMCTDMRLVELVTDVMKDKQELLRGMPADVRSAMMEPKRQIDALGKASQMVRDLANEQRLLDLRELDRLRAERKEEPANG